MYSIPHHHSQFDFDERAMLIGGNKTTIGHIKPIVVFIILQGNRIEICSIVTREFKVVFASQLIDQDIRPRNAG